MPGMGRSDIAAFWFGESDLATPDFIRQAAQQSLAKSGTFYTQNLGRPTLRQALAEYSSGLHGRAIAPERIGVTGSRLDRTF
jgi:aspartate/methionine/tyrosine aminotransferase